MAIPVMPHRGPAANLSVAEGENEGHEGGSRSAVRKWNGRCGAAIVVDEGKEEGRKKMDGMDLDGRKPGIGQKGGNGPKWK
jgi:hypothetical protein